MPLKVTVEKMVDAISASEQPALTKQDIADALDVSWQSIDNHEEELVEDVRVESGKIGKATVYWLAEPTGGGARGSGGPDSAGGRPAEEPPEERDETVKTATMNSGVVDPPWRTTTVAQARGTDLTVPTWVANLPYALAATKTVGLAVFMAAAGLLCFAVATTITGAAALGAIVIGGVSLGLSVVLLFLAALAQVVISRPLRHLIGLGSEDRELEG